MNSDQKYLFWFESKQDEATISDLVDKLNKLGVQAEVINGVKKPAIIQFGNKPALPAAPKLGAVRQ